MLRERFANVQPVIVRELRAQARSPVLLRVRLLAAVFAIGALGLMASSAYLLVAGRGGEAFGVLHGGMIFLLCLIGPALTADALSRERREGTLPLLWLCSLGPGDVLLGKFVAHGLVLLTAWLAAAPVLLVPLLLGGVSTGQIALFLTLEAGVGGVCLTSGLLASTWSKRAERSLLSAYFIAGSVVAMAFFFGLMGLGLIAAGSPLLNQLPSGVQIVLAGGFIALCAAALMQLQLRAARDALLVYWHRPISLEDITGPAPAPLPPLVPVANPAPVAAPRPPPVLSTEDPLALWLRKRQRRLVLRWLEREPARALALRQPAEVFMLPALGAAGLTMFWVLTLWGGFYNAAPVFGLFFRWGVVLTAAWAFRSQVWTSLMESFLATTQPAASLLRAHVWAHQRLFGPSLAVLAVGTAFEVAVTEDWWRLTWLAGPAGMFWAAPRVGAWASLRFRSFIVAMLFTVLLGLLLPAVTGWWCGEGLSWWLQDQDAPWLRGQRQAVAQLASLLALLPAGWLAGRRAVRWLESRQGFAHLRTE